MTINVADGLTEFDGGIVAVSVLDNRLVQAFVVGELRARYGRAFVAVSYQKVCSTKKCRENIYFSDMFPRYDLLLSPTYYNQRIW